MVLHEGSFLTQRQKAIQKKKPIKQCKNLCLLTSLTKGDLVLQESNEILVCLYFFGLFYFLVTSRFSWLSSFVNIFHWHVTLKFCSEVAS